MKTWLTNPLYFSSVRTRYGGISTRCRIFRLLIETTIGKPDWLQYYSRFGIRFRKIARGFILTVRVRPWEYRFRMQISGSVNRVRKIYKCPNCNFEGSKRTFLFRADIEKREDR